MASFPYLFPMKFFFPLLLFLYFNVQAQNDSFYLIKPDRVFDGTEMHTGWVVLVKGKTIEAAGPMNFKLPAQTRIIEAPGTTLLPGFIEGHSHLFLHPYNEVSWNDQVLKESRAERTARAVNHARATLLAGFTTVRDLGTEGAGFDDAGLKTAIMKGVIPGPRMLIATKAIVAKGAYGPGFMNADIDLPQGAAEVANSQEMAKEVREQIGKGADLIKLYADYRYTPEGKAAPTFTTEEMAIAVAIAKASGRTTAAHASTIEGMRRAVLAGVSTIEHGDEGDEAIFKLMKEKGVAFCPTLAAGDAVAQYQGWQKASMPEPVRIVNKRKSFQAALAAGVTICMGGDVGVYTHGDNAREMELMVAYGMKPLEVLRSATSVNADLFGLNAGRVKKGALADLVLVAGDPLQQISAVRQIRWVMKDGRIWKEL
jgi:imidazolonepropionase-like amidohydrolase